MRAARLALGTVGVAGIVLGLLLLPWSAWPSLGVWSVGLALLHDGLWAPLVVAVGWLAARLLPAPARTPVLIGALVSVALVALALPVLGSGGRRPTNPTVLDRNYGLGLAVALGVTWGLVAAAVLVGATRRRPLASRGGGPPPR